MKFTLSLILFLIFTSTFFAQSKITGTITDQSVPVEFCNIVLLNASDSTILKAELTDQKGLYTFDKLDSSEYILKTIMLGYEDYYTKKFILDEDLEIAIKLNASSTTLDAVEVVAKKPFLEQKAGKLVVNVADNTSNINGSMMDVMKKVPGLLVTNKSVSVAGGGSTKILIDGRETEYIDMQSLLKDMPADDIDKIEIIHQPGAEYEASGSGAIINIKLKKNRLNGFNGSLSSSIGYAIKTRYSTFLNANYRKGPFNLYGSIGFNHRYFEEGLDVTRYIGEQKIASSSDSPFNPTSFYPKLGIDYDLNDAMSIGAKVTYYQSNKDIQEINSTDISFAGEPIAKVASYNKNKSDWGYYASSAYYQWEIDTASQTLGLDLSIAGFNSNGNQFIDILENQVKVDQIKNIEDGENQIYVGKLDYKYPFSNNLSVNLGGKYSYANVHNKIDAFNYDNTWVIDPILTHDFEFKESIKALYAKTNFQKGKIDGNIGLRWERSDATGYSKTIDSTLVRNIDKVFPSASINIGITEHFGTALAYSKRINRPKYSSLNPYTEFLDPYTSTKGNPFLKPEIADSYKFSVTYDKQPFLNFEYTKTEDAIAFITRQNNDTGEGYGIETNLNSFEKYGGSLFFPLSFIKGFDGYGGVFVYYNVYQDDELESGFELSKWSWFSFLQTSYNITKKWQVDFTGWYTSGGLEGVMVMNPMYGLSAGTEYELLDGQLVLSLNWDDFLVKFFNAGIKYGGLRGEVVSAWTPNVINFKAKWKFGNRYLKTKKERDGSSEEIRRAKK